MLIRMRKEDKETIIHSIQDYFYQERSVEIGQLAAENFFEFVMKEIGPHFYNQGVKDTRAMVEQKIFSLDEDIRSLERPIPKNAR